MRDRAIFLGNRCSILLSYGAVRVSASSLPFWPTSWPISTESFNLFHGVSQIPFTDNIIAAKNAVGLPAAEFHYRLLTYSGAIHFSRKASAQVVKGSGGFDHLHLPFLDVAPYRNGPDRTGNAGLVAGRIPRLLKGTDRIAVQSKNVWCGRCGHLIEQHNGVYGLCTGLSTRGALCLCQKFAKCGTHRENPARPIFIASHVKPDFVCGKVHLVPSQTLDLGISPTRQESEHHERVQGRLQKTAQTLDLLAGKETRSRVVFSKGWHVRGMEELPAADCQVERVAHQFQFPVDASRFRAFRLAPSRVFLDLGRSDLGNLAPAKVRNQMQPESGLGIVERLEAVDLVIGQNIIGEFTKQDGLRSRGNRGAFRQFAHSDRELAFGFIPSFVGLVMPRTVRVRVSNAKRASTVLDASSFPSQASAPLTGGVLRRASNPKEDIAGRKFYQTICFPSPKENYVS